jgi:predicted outer membrane repeat protein
MKIGKQILSILVSTCLVMGMLPVVSFAAEDNGEIVDTNGLCEHHTAHDETCGYVEGIEGSPCTHEHGAECYTEVTSCTHTHTEECYPVLDNDISGNDATPSEPAEPTECSHECSAESGCIVQELNCLHEHDENCGYVQEVEGHPCTYVCELCGVTEITEWSWVDEQEVIDPESGVLALTGASAKKPVLYDEIVDMLPTEITATTEDDTETVTLDGWDCDNYPEEGAYTGSYLFNAALPDGYALAEDAPALTVTVKFGGVAVLEATVHSDDHSHPICGATHTDIGDHKGTCEAVEWTEWDGTSEITYDSNNTAYVYLTGDATRNATLNVKGGYTLYLCLNGNSIRRSSSGEVITVGESASLILCDCKGGGKITHSEGIIGRGVNVGTSSALKRASFWMFGGEISGNISNGQDGAGVNIRNSTLKIYGGKISDNHLEVADYYGGGGVCAHDDSRFYMYGGEISNNSSADDGGGVCAWGVLSVEISGGTISGNTATKNGGGIYTNTNLKISGGTINGNTATGDGGGIWTKAYLKIDDSTIDGNKAAKGGGVYYNDNGNSIMQIQNSKVIQNKATDGGGIYVNNSSTLEMRDSSITGNTVTGNGGGVYNNGTFQISGNTEISGNTKNSVSNNVYLPTNKYIIITGTLTGSKIGVTTEATPSSSSYIRIATGYKNYADPEKFLYENDGTLSVSAVGSSNVDLVVCKHSESSDWSVDDSNHWHNCSICNAKIGVTAHTYDQKDALEAYKKSDATCTSGAIYYMSCVCGMKGTETFESGDKNPDNHSGNLGDWQSDNSQHWKEYSCCSVRVNTAKHTPGPDATEETPQTCTECGYELAPALEHTHIWGAWTSNGDGTHSRTCTKDSSHTETNSCSGGKATCQSPATCSTCSQTYGDKDMNNHTGGTEVRDRVEPTTSAPGYTGDTYCKGCNTKIKDGRTIPKKKPAQAGNTNSGDNSGSGNSSNIGTDNGSSSNNTASTPVTIPAVTSVTVPVSGDEKTIRVDAKVSGTTATIEKVDLSKLDTVIGEDVKTGVVTIDFSVLEKKVDTVKLPANVIKQIAKAVNDPDNDAESLEIVLNGGTSIEFDAKTLEAMTAQAKDADIIISIKRTTDSTLNSKQKQTVGSRPAWEVSVTSGGKNILGVGGKVTVSAPYELGTGEKASGIAVYYVDAKGSKKRCETSYDSVKKRVKWKTDHLSVYMIGYDKSGKKDKAAGNTRTVSVAKGDTLWTISRKYGCTVSEIVAANSDLIKNPNRIYLGWQLNIPQN